jgi:uncharacterized protein YndB with AHSA1/START domain
MTAQNKKKITVSVTVNAAIQKVWECWTGPEHIKKWNNATDDWHTPVAENDLRVGGSFLSRMEAKDGSFGFDFSGIYDTVTSNRLIEYTLGDGRKVKIEFEETASGVIVQETFEAESENPVDMQQMGWQMILDNFKRYVERVG